MISHHQPMLATTLVWLQLPAYVLSVSTCDTLLIYAEVLIVE